jgi:hypothetical protein
MRLVAVIVITGVLAGCAGAAHDRAGRAQQAPAPARGTVTGGAAGAPYRWLVPTQGPQPTIAAENREPGTRAWRLPGPGADVGGLRQGDVAGYVAEQALMPGQRQRIYVSAPRTRFVRISVFRIGWYGGAGGREVLVSDRLRTSAQPPCRHRYSSGLTECDWHPTLTFTIPSALPSGVYVAKLAARTGQSDCLFVVLGAAAQPLLAQLPTSTYEAYNAWGGDSLYPGGADRVGITHSAQGVEVSYDRPYDSVTGAGEFFARDVAMVRFLERYRYPVSYTTSESIDEDPAQLAGPRAVLDFGHSEYWSQRQAGAFARARTAGTSLLFLSSDTLGWRVRYLRASGAASEAGQPDHTIVAYKEHAALDPERRQPTGHFPDGGASLTGTAYLGCITPRLALRGPPVYRYYPWVPARRRTPAWLFAGTGVRAATTIPGVVGYELDMRTQRTPAGTQLVGSGAAACMPADPAEPHPAPGENLAQTTIYTARSGAIVFSAGTLGWELGLEPVPSASPEAPRKPDPRVVAITRNLLARVLDRSASARAGGR